VVEHLPPRRVGDSPHPRRNGHTVTQLDRDGLQNGGHPAGYGPRGDPGTAVDELGDRVECSGLCSLTIAHRRWHAADSVGTARVGTSDDEIWPDPVSARRGVAMSRDGLITLW
jgi:hypothetical protein